MQEEFENRRISDEKKNIDFITTSSMKVDNTQMQYTINLLFDVYVIDNSKYGDKDSTYSDRIFDRLYLANLIQYHMEPYFRDEKGLVKLKEQVGLMMYEDLELLNKVDRLAH